MAYQIIRVAGYKNGAKGQKGFGGIQIHDQREKGVSHTNEDIDWSRVHLNYDLHNGEQRINFAEKINERIASLNLKRALRKDANVMAQIFISASPEWFGQIDEQAQKKYFEDAYKWVCERYGIENIISAAVHLDEATPHIHINLVPVVNNKVCYADLFTEKPQKSRGRNGGQLTALHDDFHKHNQESGYNLERGELQSATGKKEHLSVLDFKKQERGKEVNKLNEKSKNLTREIQDLEALKIQTAESVSELRLFVSELQGEVNDLEEEKVRLDSLKSDLKQQIKTEGDILKNLDGKIKTRKGIEQIRERTSKILLGDALKISKDDFDGLVKTALSSPRVETSEENKSLKVENEIFAEKAAQVESLDRKLSRAYKNIKAKDEEINDLSEQLVAQAKRVGYWVVQARSYEADYNRVLKELNQLKGKNKNMDRGAR